MGFASTHMCMYMDGSPTSQGHTPIPCTHNHMMHHASLHTPTAAGRAPAPALACGCVPCLPQHMCWLNSVRAHHTHSPCLGFGPVGDHPRRACLSADTISMLCATPTQTYRARTAQGWLRHSPFVLTRPSSRQRCHFAHACPQVCARPRPTHAAPHQPATP